MRKEIFLENEYYHLYNRGVDKRLIFMDERDRFRFTNTLYVLNNFQDIPFQFDVASLYPKDTLVAQAAMVEIVAACFMPNHYHMLVRPLQNAAISRFLQKVGVSYTRYFNKRHERSGALFESTFKAKHVSSHDYAVYLTKYIHFNPLPFILGTKESDPTKDIFMYPWSTLTDYVGGKSNISHLTNMNFRDKVLDMDAHQYRVFCLDFLKEATNIQT